MMRWSRVLFVLCFGAVLAFAWRGTPSALPRGPFLQDLTPTEVSIVFKTADITTPIVRYGTSPGAPWQFEQSGASGTTHVIRLAELKPETVYYYEIADGNSVLAGGKELTYFRTAPPENSRAPFRFVAFGDSGTGNTTQYDVSEQMAKLVPAPELALGLGDLVYENGAAADFDPKLFEPNRELFPRVAFWPTIGNHEARTSNGAPFYDAFYLPTDTGAPGHPSNSERYYSFDYGMAHFACIDSETSSSAPGSPMYTWLADDLDDANARGKRWLIAFMHHPPYSKGSHNSNVEADLIMLRQNLVPLFESKGVDMVLVGHSHSYERSYLAQGDAVLQNDPSTYSKIGSPNGTIYLVSGCAGKSEGGSLDHSLMSVSRGLVAGFSAIDVSFGEIRGYFVEKDGETTDVFTLRKAADTREPRISHLEATGAHRLVATFDEPLAPGTGPPGAENVANYLLNGGATVVAATLGSDQHTVELITSTLTPDKSYELTVLRVQDVSGNAIEEIEAMFVRSSSGEVTSAPGVPEGATWRYFKGTSSPPSIWNRRTFDDGAWAQGTAGFGFADSDDATELSDMLNGYLSLYTRASFVLDDPQRITGMELRVSYDDGFVAYLNGTEVARANVPDGQTSTTPASGSHEADDFESFDLDAFTNELAAGTNVLAIQGHNSSISSNDFSLHPALFLTETSGNTEGPPLAQMECDILTANVPARIDFSSEGSRDDGSVTHRSWHFGDGTASVESPSVQHLFDRVGMFVVSLVVEDDEGHQSIDQKTVRIHAQGASPTASLSASASKVVPGGSLQFYSAGSGDPDGGTIHVHWDFGDPASGPANHSTTPDPTHVFATAGIYTVTLTVTDDEGSGGVIRSAITVEDESIPAPVAAFVTDVTSGEVPLQVSFSDQTAGDVTSWAWDFGDGTSSTEQHPIHTYAQTGIFTVRLEASGPGGSDSSTQVDLIEVVAAGQILADFHATPSGLQVSFSDASTGDVTSREWDFGDGATSAEAQPVHTYAAAGDYLVTLTVTGPAGTDSKQRIVRVTAGGGGSSGGGCFGAIGEGSRPTGDPSLPLILAFVLLALALRREAARSRTPVAPVLRRTR